MTPQPERGWAPGPFGKEASAPVNAAAQLVVTTTIVAVKALEHQPVSACCWAHRGARAKADDASRAQAGERAALLKQQVGHVAGQYLDVQR
jgi:hypothetical protein